MTNNIRDEHQLYKTADLALASAVYLSFPLEAIDHQDSRKSLFVFKRNNKLDELIERFWRGELRIEPSAYFGAIRSIKARLYGDK